MHEALGNVGCSQSRTRGRRMLSTEREPAPLGCTCTLDTPPARLLERSASNARRRLASAQRDLVQSSSQASCRTQSQDPGRLLAVAFWEIGVL